VSVPWSREYAIQMGHWYTWTDWLGPVQSWPADGLAIAGVVAAD